MTTPKFVPEQTAPIGSPSNPLEQFLLLAKSARGAAASSLIMQALNSPNVYVFGELLNMPNVQELAKSTEFKTCYDLLEIFAFGTFANFVSNRQNLPPLSDQMATKLRQLTIVSLATKNKHIPYVVLLKELGINNVRELEDLIIDAVYNGVIVAKLDQRNQQLEVDRCMGRDVRAEETPKIIATLTEFCDRCQVLLGSMEEQINKANRSRAESILNKQKVDQEFNNIKKTLKVAASSSPSVGTSDFDDNIIQDVSSSAENSKKPARRVGLRGSAKSSKN